MRNVFRGAALSVIATALCLGATPATADVFVLGTIDLNKDITVLENITIDKVVDLEVDVDIDAEKFAESHALINQRTEFNEACQNCAEKRSIIVDSGNANSGVLVINQSTGNMGNQGAALAIAVDVFVPPVDPPPTVDDDYGFAEAQSAVEQQNNQNDIETVNILFRDAIMLRALNNNSGVVLGNQSSGNMNNQANSVAIALSLAEEGVALAEADLGQFNTNNSNLESDSGVGDNPTGINKLATINTSLNGNSGVIGFNQSAGNLANQANVFSIATVIGQ